MNDDEIERRLRELPAPALPDAWRASILATARRATAPRERFHEAWPAALVCLRRLCARNPVTVGALAASWLVILLFKAGTPYDPVDDRLLAQARAHPPGRFLPLGEELRLAESWQDDGAFDRTVQP